MLDNTPKVTLSDLKSKLDSWSLESTLMALGIADTQYNDTYSINAEDLHATLKNAGLNSEIEKLGLSKIKTTSSLKSKM